MEQIRELEEQIHSLQKELDIATSRLTDAKVRIQSQKGMLTSS